VDAVIARCDRELQFYLAYLDYIAPLKAAGLSFAYPLVSTGAKEESASDAFDIALAAKLVRAGGSVVTNGFALRGDERVLVVSGPNNGGKTTFARMFGQLHHLAALGLPVPGTAARLFLADRLFTHFEREEDLTRLRSKFEDELVRIRDLLACATGESVVILNETFGSTAVHDAVLVGTRVMHRLLELGVIGVFVTFVDELAALSPSTVSMMSTVDPDDPAIRTFRIVRKPADGRAYAAALAAKYGLTRSQLRARIVP
jgi:DNA mismatch repair protein MutS